MPDQPQLWPAGPVRVQPGRTGPGKSHKRATIPGECNEPGCTNPRRRTQGARYCEDHAHSNGYLGKTRNENAGNEHVACHRCGQDFRRKRQTWATQLPVSKAWRAFCPECCAASPLTLAALRAHHVPYDMAHAWLMHGRDLRCEFPGCGRKLGHNQNLVIQPCIDHDHQCCPTSKSCGECIRGVVCTSCNTSVGQVERLREHADMDAIDAYITRHRGRGRGAV